MEFEDLSEEMQWEARRVAAAFGVEEWAEDHSLLGWNSDAVRFAGLNGRHTMRWEIGRDDEIKAELYSVNVGGEDCPGTHVSFNDILEMHDDPSPGELELMARGLYCLGFEDETLLARLPQFTAHEKLELRLSMPREFWPQHWFDEDAGGEGKPT